MRDHRERSRAWWHQRGQWLRTYSDNYSVACLFPSGCEGWFVLTRTGVLILLIGLSLRCPDVVVSIAVAGAAAYFILDALVVNTAYVFESRPPISPLRSALLTIVAYLDLALGFSVGWLWLGPADGSQWNRGITAVYQSLRTLATVGPEGNQASIWGKLLAIAELFVGLYFVVIVVAIYVTWARTGAAEPSSSSPQQQAQPNAAVSTLRSPDWWARAVGALSLCVLIVYTIFAGAQWLTMQRALDATERGLDATERAWLLSKVDHFEISNEHLPTVIFELRNVGKSPAFNIKYGVACWPEAKYPPGEDNPWPSDITIAPGGEPQKDLKAKCWNASPAYADAMSIGAKDFYIWIRAVYRDPFSGGKVRLTWECWHKPVGAKPSFKACEIPGVNNIYK